jgi:hypothetical protein
MRNIVNTIIDKNRGIALFWSKAHGWAPKEAADLLAQSRLDLQVAFSETLFLWLDPTDHPGRIRLAWVNIGALLEGSLKWFLAIFYKDYVSDPASPRQDNKLIPPDELKFERLKQFFAKRIQHVYDDHRLFIERTQFRRNGIHSFKHRDIGTQDEVLDGIRSYHDLLLDIDSIVPYPDEGNVG